jgi:TfoX/Sxy family transcriptional regulator of competence genes
MASNPRTIETVTEQMAAAGDVSARPMFGEYGIYCDGKMVAMVCDDQLFVKPTPGGRAFAPELPDGTPYPGAKPCLLVDAERWDEGDWLSELVRITARELPLPKPRKPRAR